jgi:hypothetical protein
MMRDLFEVFTQCKLIYTNIFLGNIYKYVETLLCHIKEIRRNLLQCNTY